jgi:hypothetical protein
VPDGVEPGYVAGPKVEHDYFGKRSREGGAVCRECASRAAVGAGVAARDVWCEFGGVSAGLRGGDASGACASEAPRAATANTAPSAALPKVDFSDACGPRAVRMARTSTTRSASSANESGASLKSPDSSTICTTPSLDMAARVRSGGGGGRGGSATRIARSGSRVLRAAAKTSGSFCGKRR